MDNIESAIRCLQNEEIVEEVIEGNVHCLESCHQDSVCAIFEDQLEQSTQQRQRRAPLSFGAQSEEEHPGTSDS